MSAELVEPFTARQAKILKDAYPPATHVAAVHRQKEWPEAKAQAKAAVERYFQEHVQTRLFHAAQGGGGCSVIEIDGGASNFYVEALAQELVVFLRGRGFYAAYGQHVTRYADELEDDEFWPVFVNW